MLPPSVRITAALSIPLTDISFRFARSGGPGGQNVNKVASKVELLFDVAHSPHFTEHQRRRIGDRLEGRIDAAGVLHITVEESRSQWANRERAVERFAELLAGALRPVKKRVSTAPTRTSREKRLLKKRGRASLKKLRKGPAADD